MDNYDSILKEKKKYEEPIKPVKNKKFPWLLTDLICLILLLIISYFFYYTRILSPEQIFLNDLKEITTKYQKIFTPLEITSLNNDNYNLTGILSLNEEEYNFDINKNNSIMKLSLNKEDKTLEYYSLSNQNYLKLSDKYYQLSNDNHIYLIYTLKDYLLNIPKDKFIKKFYIKDNTPTVESNLVLNSEDLNTNLNLNTKVNSYEVLFTFKNHAITNDIISMKITINNLTTTKREVILYENNILTYKDDTQTLKFHLEEKNKDFTLKTYQNNTIYSVLTGTNQQSSYQYTYQIIDKIYNINLKVIKENELYTYEISSTIEKDNIRTQSNLNINIKQSQNTNILNNEITNPIKYDSLSKEEKKQYQTELNTLLTDLRQFIKQHQYSIN